MTRARVSIRALSFGADEHHGRDGGTMEPLAKLLDAARVDAEILRALGSLKARVFLADGTVDLRDEDNAPNLTMAFELIECFLVPALFGGLSREVKALLPYEDARRLMIDALAIAAGNAKTGDGQFLGGAYLIRDDVTESEDREITDAASFSMTACAHFRTLYYDEVMADSDMESKTADLIAEAMRFLRAAMAVDDKDVPVGWCWGDKGSKFPYRYFTYVALDGALDLTAYLNRSDAPRIVGQEAMLKAGQMRDLVGESASSLLRYLDEEGLALGALELPDDVTDKPVRSWYFNLWTVYSLLAIWGEATKFGVPGIDEARPKLEVAVGRIVSEYVPNPSRADFERIELNLGLVTGNAKTRNIGKWLDRSFAPLLLKTYAAFAKTVSARTAATDRNMSVIVDDLLNRRDPAFEGVWDRAGRGYSIYYTERAIEALVRFKDYLELTAPGIEERSSAPVSQDMVSMVVQVPVGELRSALSGEAAGSAEALRATLDAAVRELLEVPEIATSPAALVVRGDVAKIQEMPSAPLAVANLFLSLQSLANILKKHEQAAS